MATKTTRRPNSQPKQEAVQKPKEVQKLKEVEKPQVTYNTKIFI